MNIDRVIKEQFNGFEKKEYFAPARLLYVKPGLGLGGGSFNDLKLLKIFQELGANIKIKTGYVSGVLMDTIRNKFNFNFKIDPCLDRNSKSDVEQIKKSITQEIIRNQSNILLFSQSFLGDAPRFSQAVAELSSIQPTILREHNDLVEFKSIASVHADTIALPVNKFIGGDIKSANCNIEIISIPAIIDIEDLESSNIKSEQVRESFGANEKDYIIFQPTRVGSAKRIDRAIVLANKLRKSLKQKNVILLIAGGNEPEKDAIIERAKLELLAKNLNVKILFLNGISDMRTKKKFRISDYMRASDLVTFMSEKETWGIPPAESCVAGGMPCVTARYTDHKGRPLYDQIYDGFSFITEDNPKGDGVSKKTVESVLAIANNPALWDASSTNNRIIVEKYSKRAIKSSLSLLFHKINKRRN